ncbi:hypothetical protein [Thalassomonas actiniarum]|uniref:hypothetical protein n=1 Tax=Thalassomonas actiniarum TaxID=485447 RepID=UPI00308253F0
MAAEIALHSAESQLLFTLMTQKKFPEDGVDPLVLLWNFYGQEFQFNDLVRLSIQDQAGLLNLHTIHQGRFLALLQSNGLSEQRSTEILARLLDWQDSDALVRANGRESSVEFGSVRNGAIPDITELEHVLELSPEEKQLIYQNCGIFFLGDFNPMMAPIPLIASLSDQLSAQQIALLRESNQLTRTNFIEITDIKEEEDMRFYPSNVMKVIFKSSVNKAFVTRELVISLSPYAKNNLSPINVLVDKS